MEKKSKANIKKARKRTRNEDRKKAYTNIFLYRAGIHFAQDNIYYFVGSAEISRPPNRT